MRNPKGFTLLELIVVIVVVGILAGIGTEFIVKPVEGYNALARRSGLVDTADNAVRRMQRDIRQGLPNSIRVALSGKCLELIHVANGGRYRAQGPGDPLVFTTTDDAFDVIGELTAAPAAGQFVVVYNISGNAYTGNNLATVGAGSTTTSVLMSPAFKFPQSSPYQRFFIVDEPVTYYFDSSAQTLTRYSGYAIQNPQPTDPAVLGTGTLMAKNVTACSFSYEPGAAKRAGLITLELAITDQGETITLLQQVHVGNAP